MRGEGGGRMRGGRDKGREEAKDVETKIFECSSLWFTINNNGITGIMNVICAV